MRLDAKQLKAMETLWTRPGAVREVPTGADSDGPYEVIVACRDANEGESAAHAVPMLIAELRHREHELDRIRGDLEVARNEIERMRARAVLHLDGSLDAMKKALRDIAEPPQRP